MINGTLFLQIFNFYIGYCILKRIVLKPALQLIDQYDEKVKQLNHALVDLKNQVSAHEEQTRKLWQECSRTLVTTTPVIEKAVYQCDMQQKIKQVTYDVIPLSEEAKEVAVEVLAQKIVDSMVHDASEVIA